MSIKIGDRTVIGEVPLPWEQVPDGALVRVLPDSHQAAAQRQVDEENGT